MTDCKGIEIQPGQVWTYKDSSGQEEEVSRVVILSCFNVDGYDLACISIDDVNLNNEGKVYKDISMVPISMPYLLDSLCRMESKKRNDDLYDNYLTHQGYLEFMKNFSDGKETGFFTFTVTGIVDHVSKVTLGVPIEAKVLT